MKEKAKELEIKRVNIDETSLPEFCINVLHKNLSVKPDPLVIKKFIHSAIAGVHEVMNILKGENKVITFQFNDLSGEFIAGARLEFVKSEDNPEDEGHYQVEWSFYKEVILDNIPEDKVHISKSNADPLASIFAGKSYDLYNMKVHGDQLMTYAYVLSGIKKYLMVNAQDNTRIEVFIENVVDFTAEVISHIKEGSMKVEDLVVLGFDVSGPLKQDIKTEHIEEKAPDDKLKDKDKDKPKTEDKKSK